MAEVTTTSVFMSGRSQAVRIPKAFRIDAERVEIRKRGQELVLKPVEEEDQWASLREAVEMFREDDTDWDEILKELDEPLLEPPRLSMDFDAKTYANYEKGRK